MKIIEKINIKSIITCEIKNKILPPIFFSLIISNIKYILNTLLNINIKNESIQKNDATLLQ